jgi:beta-galactosidase
MTDAPHATRRLFLAAAGGGFAALNAPAAGRAVAPADEPEGRSASPRSGGRRERLSLDEGWRFIQAALPFPPILGHEASYAHAKAGNAEGPAAVDYDDSDWGDVNLPHDFALGQPFDPAANLSQGYRRRGLGWYRRSFTLAPGDDGKHLELQFDGVATFATIWINGNIVHRNFSGYTGFTIDLTPFAQYGEDMNTLVVRADADALEGWWYEGAGIYRHVWLVKRDAVHIATDGVHCDPRPGQDGGWTVPVSATLYNSGEATQPVEVRAEVYDPQGRRVSIGYATADVAPLDKTTTQLALPVSAPRLWSVESPTLYTVRVEVWRDGVLADAVETPVGFRTLRFDAARGFFLNDMPTKIKGVCVHQDVGGVGVAVPDSLWDVRLRQLKAMGANALRCAHNAVASELLDAADRLGVLVMAENRNFNVSEDYLPQLEWMVRRDRNHPSIFLWSVCNEESIQGTEVGVQMVRRMAAAVKALDDRRPVTAAMNSGMFATQNISQVVDVVGFNYQAADYDRFHAENPGRPMFSSEDTSAYMTRGEFTTDLRRHVLASYDEEHAAWGATNRKGWRTIATRPFMAGGFLWTGFDYRGEPTPFEWPTVGSSFGAMDLCGFPKTAFYIHQALWRSEPMLHLAPHWTWPGREGQAIEVMAITNAERVILNLNGRQVADLKIDPYDMAACMVAYAPGRLEGLAYRRGRIVARAVVETAGAPTALRLTPDRMRMAGDGRDAQPVRVEVLDAKGRAVPTGDISVSFEALGGRIIGLGDGDPNSHEGDVPAAPTLGSRRLYNGLAQAIVQTDSGGGGALILSARATGLRPASVRIAVAETAPPPSVAPARAAQTLTEWRQSPPTAARPDPTLKI